MRAQMALETDDKNLLLRSSGVKSHNFGLIIIKLGLSNLLRGCSH